MHMHQLHFFLTIPPNILISPTFSFSMASRNPQHKKRSPGFINSHTPPVPLAIPMVKLLLLTISSLPLLHASPLGLFTRRAHVLEEEPMPSNDPSLWIYLLVAIALVLLGGAFAGLTIALMGQVNYTGKAIFDGLS